MDVRDALEADAEEMAAIADSPTDVMRNLIHDRSVRVAVDGVGDPDGTTERAPGAGDDGGPDADPDSEPGRSESMLGFVSFDARPDVVHVTQLEGTSDACARLLEEPLGFARREGMPVEMLVPGGNRMVRDAVETAGFDERGAGPQFDGRATVRYRFDP